MRFLLGSEPSAVHTRTPRTRMWIGLFALTLVLSSPASAQHPARYASEPDWIEVMFASDARVRLRGGELRDFATPALTGVNQVLEDLPAHEWHRLCPVTEEQVDSIRERGIANTGGDLPDLNNVYRLRIQGGDVWEVATRLEALPGVQSARPVPRPIAPPLPPAYVQDYRAPAAWTPTGTAHDYFAGASIFGKGLGVRIVDLEYSWNYNHADISKAAASQINVDVVDPFSDDDHGTAVIGMLSADDNGWGVRGLCPDALLHTCGTYFGNPPMFNPAGAILVALNLLPPGNVLLLELQWDYLDPNTTTPEGDLIPIEWWTDTYPDPQTANPVYSAIQLATANNQYVIEAAGNGYYDLDSLTFVGDSGAFIVGAGGAYPGGAYPEGDLERLSFSSFGSRVNLQGWGENVITTGYGDLYQEGATNDLDYTQTFRGTSSASAHVAAAVACYAAWHNPTYGPLAPGLLRDRFQLHGTDQVMGPFGHIGPRPDLLRLWVSNLPLLDAGGDWGDAPDGVLAYPNGPVGSFPTALGPDWMFHPPQPGLLYLGNELDFEYEGNGGLPFTEFFEYDFDECSDQNAPSSDDGLLYPGAYTIQSGAIVSCPTALGHLGPPCGEAAWGVDIDLEVVNQLPDAWLHVLVDWNQDGVWGGVDNGCASPAPELVLANIHVPFTGSTPVALSTVVSGLPPIQIGSRSGYVWARFTLTDALLPFPGTWNGGLGSGGWGDPPLGETEDYLLNILDSTAGVAEGTPSVDAPPAAFPNPFTSGTSIHFHLSDPTDVSVDVYDVLGRLVRRLDAGRMDAGRHQLAWDGLGENGKKVAPGIYFGTISRGNLKKTIRLNIVR